jgi:hypothetical protein
MPRRGTTHRSKGSTGAHAQSCMQGSMFFSEEKNQKTFTSSPASSAG